jgi:hypothetical protein
MKSRFSWAFAIALAFLSQGVRAQSFPMGDVFRPLVADPLETRTFLSVVGADFEQGQTTAASVGIGANFGFYRWPGERPGDGWQLGMFAMFASQFDLEGESYPLINTDFRVGFSTSFRRGPWSGRAKLLHQSSHLGDEFLLQGNAPSREDLSVELVDLVFAYERSGWRPYIGTSYLFHTDPGSLKKWGLQAGVDYLGSTPVLFGGRLVGGLDIRAHEEMDWRKGVSARIGLTYGRPEPERRGITVLFEYYDGPSPFGQFYHDVISYYGVALQFHY